MGWFYWCLRKLSDVYYWFLYRFHPKHRYHVLKLHPPQYMDPDHQMVYAVMGVVERYVNELRNNHLSDSDLTKLSDLEVLDYYIEWFSYPEDQKYYKDLRDIVEWWAIVKDDPILDSIPENDSHHHSMVDYRYVTGMLQKVLTHRSRMWT